MNSASKFLVTLSLSLVVQLSVAQDKPKLAKYDTCAKCISNTRLTNIINDDEPFAIQFVGNGNIQNSLESGGKIPTNTGIGVSVRKYLYTEYKDSSGTVNYVHNPFWGCYKIELDASINVASTVDTLETKVNANNVVQNQNEFGTSILTPLNQGGGQAANIELVGYFVKTYGKILSGARIKFIGSNRNWLLTDTAGSKVDQVTTSMFRAGVFHEFVVAEARKDYSVALGLGYAYNGVSGNLGLSKNSGVREWVLGTDRTGFHGAELTLDFKLKNIKVNFAYPWFPGQGEVSGLTGGRLITSVAFIGGFGLKI